MQYFVFIRVQLQYYSALWNPVT